MKSERSWGRLGMSLINKEYYLIFDTNVLFQKYDKKADFTTFSFNSTFKNVIDMVNQLDIYEQVTIVIPEVTWNEMKKQIVDAHQKKVDEYKSYITKWILPEFSISEIKIDDYIEYITKEIDTYKSEIQSGINNIMVLPIPSDNRFKGIVQRAFDKAPPFGGKEKNSDKGFKDVLIWESILELTYSHKYANILFYTKDKGFKEILKEEFQETNHDADISILSSEDEIKSALEEWAKAIDIYKYQPIEPYFENRDFIDWLQSPDFEIQMIDRDYGLVEKSRLITETCLKLKNYDNINIINESEQSIDYSVDVTLEISYKFKGGGTIKETVDVTVIVENILGEYYSVEDAFRTDDEYSTDNSEES